MGWVIKAPQGQMSCLFVSCKKTSMTHKTWICWVKIPHLNVIHVVSKFQASLSWLILILKRRREMLRNEFSWCDNSLQIHGIYFNYVICLIDIPKRISSSFLSGPMYIIGKIDFSVSKESHWLSSYRCKKR